MPAPRPEISDLLEVDIPPGGKVITISDLHLPPVRTDVSGRSCETLASRLDTEPGPLTVVLAGDVVELLGFPEATATDILRAHEDLCGALAEVTGPQGALVTYAIVLLVSAGIFAVWALNEPRVRVVDGVATEQGRQHADAADP